MTPPSTPRIEAQFAQAIQALRSGKGSDAEKLLKAIAQEAPDHAESHLVLGILYSRTQRWQFADPYLTKVLLLQPNRDEAMYWLAQAKKNLGQVQEAADLCERALLIQPQNPVVLNELGLCRLTLNQPDLAERALSRAIRLAPTNGAFLFNYGMALSRLDRIYKARDAFRESMLLEPHRVATYLELVRVLEILDARTEVVQVLEQGVKVHPTEFQLLTALASALALVDRKDEAEELFQRAMFAHPLSGNAYGLWLQQEGRFEESVACFETALRSQPAQGVGYFGLAEAKQYELNGTPWLPIATQYFGSEELDLKGQTYLCYALAKASEKQAPPEQTIGWYHKANECAFRLYNEGRPFDREELSRSKDRIRQTYNAETVRTPLQGHSTSISPIFIVGMIRSGTTLLDQVLSSHPQISSAGEPVFWMREADRIKRMPQEQLDRQAINDIVQRYQLAVEAVAGKSDRITDKMPLNYPHVGLILRIFPNAKIIHMRRSPLDTCFSIYTTFLGQGPNFAYNESNIVFNYLQYLKMMEHWQLVLPKNRFTEIQYESLVEDREPILRDLADFLEVGWSDQLLHHEQNDSSIRTPSKWQARQPIYRSSLQKWKIYEPWLGELLSLAQLPYPS